MKIVFENFINKFKNKMKKLEMILNLLGTEFGNTVFVETETNKKFEVHKMEDKYELLESFEDNQGNDNYNYEEYNSVQDVVNAITEAVKKLNSDLKIII